MLLSDLLSLLDCLILDLLLHSSLINRSRNNCSHAKVFRWIVIFQRSTWLERFDMRFRLRSKQLAGQCILCLRHLILLLHNVILHRLEVNHIIEADDVFLSRCFVNNTLRINLRDISLIVEKLCVLVNDFIEVQV